MDQDGLGRGLVDQLAVVAGQILEPRVRGLDEDVRRGSRPRAAPSGCRAPRGRWRRRSRASPAPGAPAGAPARSNARSLTGVSAAAGDGAAAGDRTAAIAAWSPRVPVAAVTASGVVATRAGVTTGRFGPCADVASPVRRTPAARSPDARTAPAPGVAGRGGARRRIRSRSPKRRPRRRRSDGAARADRSAARGSIRGASAARVSLSTGPRGSAVDDARRRRAASCGGAPATPAAARCRAAPVLASRLREARQHVLILALDHRPRVVLLVERAGRCRRTPR